LGGSLLYAGGACDDISTSASVDRDLPTTGVFVFNDEGEARDFVNNDPYVKEGVVKEGEWTLKEWACVVVP